MFESHLRLQFTITFIHLYLNFHFLFITGSTLVSSNYGFKR